MSNEIKIYVTPLEPYHNAAQYGVWIDATLELDKIQEQIDDMITQRTGPVNYKISAFEGFRTYNVHSAESINGIRNVACFILDYPEFGSELINYHGSVEIARHAAAAGNYLGCFTSVRDYVEKKLLDKLTPSIRECYTRCEDIVHALYEENEIFTISTVPGNVHIFKIIK